MKRILIMRVEVEVEMEPGGLEKAREDVIYQTEKALDYWFGHVDRPMTTTSVELA
jgi:hypothetical protein